LKKNEDFTDTGLINFTKRTFIARTISQLKFYQQEVYKISPIPEIQDWLLKVSPISDEELLESCSFYIEPKKGEQLSEQPQGLKDFLAQKPTTSKLKKKLTVTSQSQPPSTTPPKKTVKSPEKNKKKEIFHCQQQKFFFSSNCYY